MGNQVRRKIGVPKAKAKKAKVKKPKPKPGQVDYQVGSALRKRKKMLEELWK